MEGYSLYVVRVREWLKIRVRKWLHLVGCASDSKSGCASDPSTSAHYHLSWCISCWIWFSEDNDWRPGRKTHSYENCRMCQSDGATVCCACLGEASWTKQFWAYWRLVEDVSSARREKKKKKCHDCAEEKCIFKWEDIGGEEVLG